MSDDERKRAALLVVDEFLDQSIEFLSVSEALDDQGFSDDELAMIHDEANDIVRFVRDRIDYYYD